MKHRCLPLVIAFVLASASTVLAQEETGTPAAPPPTPPVREAPARFEPTKPAPAPYAHHGFYLNMALGIGGARVDMTSSPAAGAEERSEVRSGVVGGQLLIGGSLAPGLVLGGGTNGHALTATRGSFGTVGPFVTFYPNPKGGLHFMGLVGLGTHGTRREEDKRDTMDVGLGASAGVGYDWWIGGDWSFGMMARATWVHTFERAATRDTQDAFAATFLLGFTYN